jgi:hypothetical protein
VQGHVIRVEIDRDMAELTEHAPLLVGPDEDHPTKVNPWHDPVFRLGAKHAFTVQFGHFARNRVGPSSLVMQFNTSEADMDRTSHAAPPRSDEASKRWTDEAIRRFASDNGITIPVARAVLKNANYSEQAAAAAVKKMRG